MATQYFNYNVKNPNTGEQGMWYYTDMTTEQATDAAARDAGTYRAVEGDVPLMIGEQQDMTTEQFYQTYNNDYPSIPITAEGLAEAAPTEWTPEHLLPDALERLESLELLYVESGVAIGEGVTATVPSGALTDIISAFNNVSSWFYEIYLDVYSWVYPFSLTANLFYHLSTLFSSLAWHFYDFASLIFEIADKATQILSWSTIWSYIKSYIPNLEQIRDGFYYWPSMVYQEITSWWSVASSTVQGWIGVVQDWTQGLISYLTNRIDSLQVSLDNFVTVTLPAIPSWPDIDSLVKSWFLNFAPFWAGWQDYRDQVVEFFTDPLQWLYDKMDEWFERFW